MIRFGLCCIFRNHPIKFRHATARFLKTKPRNSQISYLAEICEHNCRELFRALQTVTGLDIGAFRILSQLFPMFTHPEVGYTLDDLPNAAQIREIFARIRQYRIEHDIRLSFHPDQFILLNSPRNEVVENSLAELKYQALVANLSGAEVINLHLGGVYGDKPAAIRRFSENFRCLEPGVKTLLTLENDDRNYTPRDLLPVCEELGIPLVYDVHHHRCRPDDLSIAEATRCCVNLWQSLGREPYFHLSSPKSGWTASRQELHADYIDIGDFPDCWRHPEFDFTVDIEAKAKEAAVLRLRCDLAAAT